MASSKDKFLLDLVTTTAPEAKPDPKGKGKKKEIKTDANLSNIDRLKQLSSRLEILTQTVESSEKKFDSQFKILNDRFEKLELKLDLAVQQLFTFGPAVISLLEINKVILSNTTASDIDRPSSLPENAELSQAVKSTPVEVTTSKPLASTSQNPDENILIISGCVQIRPRRLRRFMISLLIVNYLEPKRDEYIPRQFLGDSQEETLNGYRRDFVDRLAYLCDVKKGGGTTVTAIGLQKTRTGLVLHVASNNNIKPSGDVEEFLNKTIKWLQNINEVNSSQTEQSILSHAISIATKERKARLKSHAEGLVKNVNEYFAEYPEAFQGAFEIIGLHLHRLCKIAKENDWVSLIDECYGARNNLTKIIAMKLGISDHQDFLTKNVIHEIGRIGAYRHATTTICNATKALNAYKPGSFIDQSNTILIEIHRSSPIVPCKLNFDNLALDEIIAPVFKDEMSHPSFTDFSNVWGPGLSLDIKFKQEGTINTKVHAELVLVDFFEKENLAFAGNDRYIGCSKGACYSCLQYICAINRINQRSGRPVLVTPASHGNVYKGWRPPDILSGSPAENYRCIARNEALDRMIEDNKVLIKRYMKERKTRIRIPDSTNGDSIVPLCRKTDYDQSQQLRLFS